MDIKTDATKTTLRHRPLIFLDLETTGLEVQKQEIIEIGAVKTDSKKPFKILEELSLKVLPIHLQTADKSALELVNFSSKDWQEAISLKEALGKLDQFAQNGVLVGFNVSFDWAFLDKAYFSLGKQDPFYYHRLDVMAMAYGKLYGKRSLKRFSLGELCQYFNIKRVQKHQAFHDAKATYLIFKKLLELK